MVTHACFAYGSPIDARAAASAWAISHSRVRSATWENLGYGSSRKARAFIDAAACGAERRRRAAERHHLAVEHDAPVDTTSVGQMSQRPIEISRRFTRREHPLLDEPHRAPDAARARRAVR